MPLAVTHRSRLHSVQNLGLGNDASLACKGAWTEQPGNVSPRELPREGGLLFHCRNQQLSLIPSQSLPFELPIPLVISPEGALLFSSPYS